MKASHVVLIERLVLIAGFLGLIIVAGSVEWRFGLFVASVGLIVSTSPWKALR